MTIIGVEEVREKFQTVCVVDGRCLILIFGKPDAPDVNSVKIVGRGYDLERIFSIAADVECVCLGVVELDKIDSAHIAIINRNARAKLENIIKRSINICALR